MRNTWILYRTPGYDTQHLDTIRNIWKLCVTSGCDTQTWLWHAISGYYTQHHYNMSQLLYHISAVSFRFVGTVACAVGEQKNRCKSLKLLKAKPRTWSYYTDVLMLLSWWAPPHTHTHKHLCACAGLYPPIFFFFFFKRPIPSKQNANKFRHSCFLIIFLRIRDFFHLLI